MKYFKAQHISSQKQQLLYGDQNRCPNLPQVLSQKPKQEHQAIQLQEVYRTDIEVHVISTCLQVPINPNYFIRQPEITEQMRKVLLNWIIDVHHKYKLLEQTYFLTVRIIDNYLSQQIIKKNKLQLVGIAALWIAAKYQETYQVPKIHNLLDLCDHTYTAKQILDMEENIIYTIGFQILSAPTPLAILELVNYRARLSEKDFLLVKYLLVAATFEISLEKYYMPLRVFSLIYFIKRMRGYVIFEEDKLKYLCRADKDLIKSVSTDLCMFWKKTQYMEGISNLRTKYGTAQYFQVSKIRITERI